MKNCSLAARNGKLLLASCADCSLGPRLEIQDQAKAGKLKSLAEAQSGLLHSCSLHSFCSDLGLFLTPFQNLTSPNKLS